MNLKSDGIKISEKYDDLYEISEDEMPTDIQIMVNNNESGAALLELLKLSVKINLLEWMKIQFIL